MYCILLIFDKTIIRFGEDLVKQDNTETIMADVAVETCIDILP